MRLLPLALTAHASAWTRADGERRIGGQAPAQGAACQFCSLDTAGWQERFHLDGDHANDAPANVVQSCPLCHLCQHMDHPLIEAEASLIWLPEMSQAAVIALVRDVHLILRANSEPAHIERGRPQGDTEGLRAAWPAYMALLERAQLAEDHVGTTSPRDFACALMGMPPSSRDRSAQLLWGVRLLPRGRLHRDGRDVYPHILDAWLAAAGGPPSLAPS